MIKFRIEMDGDDSSSIYSASGTTPLGMIEEREKKKFLKVSYLFLTLPIARNQDRQLVQLLQQGSWREELAQLHARIVVQGERTDRDLIPDRFSKDNRDGHQ